MFEFTGSFGDSLFEFGIVRLDLGIGGLKVSMSALETLGHLIELLREFIKLTRPLFQAGSRREITVSDPRHCGPEWYRPAGPNPQRRMFNGRKRSLVWLRRNGIARMFRGASFL